MIKKDRSFGLVLKEIKAFKNELINFSVEKKLNQGYPRWIVLNHKDYLERTIRDLEDELSKFPEKPKNFRNKRRRSQKKQ